MKLADYKEEFEFLLKKAIQFAENKAAHVIVLSIPDWGQTPFAKDRDENKISTEIDEFNAANKEIAAAHEVQYIDITTETRQVKKDVNLLASDGLHYSGKAHSIWAEKVSDLITQLIK